jgi:predicted amidohydrolase YtcJ
MQTINSKKLPLLSIVALTIVPLIFASGQTPQPADLILHNGFVWTVDSKDNIAQAVAIKDGKFVVVGSNKAAMRLRGPQTRVIDLQGAFVTPGFNDNHVHFASAAQFLEFNIMNVSTQEQFVARVKDVTSSLAKGEWIVGGFWGVRPMGLRQRGWTTTRAIHSGHEFGGRDHRRSSNVHPQV